MAECDTDTELSHCPHRFSTVFSFLIRFISVWCKMWMVKMTVETARFFSSSNFCMQQHSTPYIHCSIYYKCFVIQNISTDNENSFLKCSYWVQLWGLQDSWFLAIWRKRTMFCIKVSFTSVSLLLLLWTRDAVSTSQCSVLRLIELSWLNYFLTLWSFVSMLSGQRRYCPLGSDKKSISSAQPTLNLQVQHKGRHES